MRGVGAAERRGAAGPSRRAAAAVWPGRPGGPGQRARWAQLERAAKDTRGTVRRLWGYLRRQRSALILTAALVVATTVLTVLGPYLLGWRSTRYIMPGRPARPGPASAG